MEKKKKRGKYGQYNVSTMGTPTTLTTEVIQEIRNYVLDGYRDWETDRKSTRLNSSHSGESRMPSSA